MQIELTKATFTDAGAQFRGKMYVGVMKMEAWPDKGDTKVDPAVIDVNLRALCKTGLRKSIQGTGDTLVDGPLLTDEECYEKFTDQLEPQINAAVAEYESGLTQPQRELKIFEDPKLDTALSSLEVKVNG